MLLKTLSKASLTLILLILAAVSVAGCGRVAPSTTDYLRLVRHLKMSDAVVEALGDTEQPTIEEIFSGVSKWLKVDGEVVNVWEYRDAETASREAGFVKHDGFDLRRPEEAGRKAYYSHYDWIAPSHWYQGGRIVVLYVGKKGQTMDLLEGLLGSHYAGEGIGPPPVTDFQTFMDNLLAHGVGTRKSGNTPFQGDVQQSFFSGTGKRIELNVELTSENISLLEYDDEAVAVAEAEFISRDGFTYTSADGTRQVNVGWIAQPQFYRAGRLIVLYVGENRQTIDLLQELLGPPFAGEGRKR